MKKKAERDYLTFLKKIEKKHGNKETNNEQLHKIGRKMFGEKFKGVYASDKIPVMKNNQYAIVNLDDSTQVGSHWVSLIKEGNKSLVYDSFGRKTYKILPKLVQSGKGGIILETENDAEQNKIEENCGQRCLASLEIYNKYGWNGLKYI